MKALAEARSLRILRMAVLTAVLLLSGLVTVGGQHDPSGDQLRLSAGHARHGRCFGAAALDKGVSCRAANRHLALSPTKAMDDRSAAYVVHRNGKDCWSYHPSFPPNTCHFGDKHGKVDVVLAGNSHAGEWLPALQQIAAHQHWRITTELASQCVLADVIQMFPEEAARSACRSWSRGVATRVRRERPDLIVVSNRMSLLAAGRGPAGSVGAYAAGMRRILRQWKDIPIVLIRDTPVPGLGGISVPRCLMAHPHHYAACNGKRRTWISPDPGVRAARHLPNVRVTNLNNHFCGPKT